VVAVPPLVTHRNLGGSTDGAARAAREADGRADATPSMVVIDTHLARGASNGGFAAAARTLGRHHDLGLRKVGWDDKPPVFRPIRHPWRIEVAHGRLGRSRRLAKSFESTTISATGWLQVACIATTLRHLPRVRAQRALPLPA
jgi:hypothetical protein